MTFFIHNILDFPIFGTKINEYILNLKKQILKTCATNISLTSHCSASFDIQPPQKN